MSQEGVCQAATASTRCSQLSRTRSVRLARKKSTSVSVRERPGLLLHSQGRGYRLRDQRPLGERRELHQPHPVGVGSDQVASHLQGEARLAAPTGPRQGQEPRHGQIALDVPQLGLSADEAAPGSRQVVLACDQ